jgi:hypothetical protein
MSYVVDILAVALCIQSLYFSLFEIYLRILGLQLSDSRQPESTTLI